MSIAINPISNNYYAPSVTTNYTSTSAYAAYEQQVAFQDLNDIGSSSSSGSGSSSVDAGLGSADLLDLSPTALNILNGIETSSSANGFSETFAFESGLNANGTSSASGSSASGISFVGTTTVPPASSSSGSGSTLTEQQQVQVAAIVAEFATAPLTSQTFTQIENAFTAAGINPQEVSIQQLLTGYEYAYQPGLAFDGQVYTETLASELDNA